MSTTPRTLEDLATTLRVQGSLPAGFDPTAHPIIARHVFGVEPFPIGQIAAEVVAELQRTTRHLGPGEMPCDAELRKQSASTMV